VLSDAALLQLEHESTHSDKHFFKKTLSIGGMNKLATSKRAEIIRCLVEGNPTRVEDGSLSGSPAVLPKPLDLDLAWRPEVFI
jgi:hypothetical protein